MPADPPATPSPASLEVVDARGRRVVALAAAVTRLGRADENQVQVSDGHVSKRHAEIVRGEDGYVLRDVGSKAGVLCNGDPVTEHALEDGDEILLGRSCSTRIVFRSGGPSRRKTGDSVFVAAFSDTGLYVPGGPGAAAAPGGSAEPAAATGGLQSLARFLELSRTLSGHLTPTEIVESVVDMAIETIKAERGFVVLTDDGGELRFMTVRGRGVDPQSAAPPAISETIVRQVLESKAPRVVSNVSMDPKLAAAQSVVNLQLGSVVAIPLWRHTMPDTDRHARATDEVFGVLCLDSQRSREALDEVDLGILRTLARDASSAIENARLLRESEEKRRMEQELARAREVQAALVPDDYWSDPHFDIAGAYVPCLDLAGDFLGQFRLRDGDASFVVADVCGKGVQAALLAAALQGALLVEFASRQSLARVAQRANDVVGRIAPLGKFISLVACSLAADGTLRYVNAGHCPLVVVRAGSVDALVTGGLALGLDESARYEEHAVQMAPGDALILYSDGVLEAMNAEREPFGAERLEQAVADAHGRSAEAICARLLEAVRAYAGDAPADDDTTLMVVTYRGG